MSEIELKRANVVKRVDSEDKAKALEAKGFVRTDGTVANKTESNAASEAVINELKEQLLKAGKVIEASDARRGELEKERPAGRGRLDVGQVEGGQLTFTVCLYAGGGCFLFRN